MDFDELADSIKYMFAGTATGILSIKDIVDLYFNYGASTTNNSNSSSAIQSASAAVLPDPNTRKCKNVKFIRNGVCSQENICLEKMNGQPCLRVTGSHDFVIFLSDVRQVYDYAENGDKYLCVKTGSNTYRIQFPESSRSKWKEAIQSKIKSAAQPQIKPALSSVSRNSSTSTYNVTMEGYGSGHLRVSDRYVEYIEKNLTCAYTYIQDVKRSGSQLTVYSKYNHYTIHFQDASQAAVVESKILKKI